MRLALLAPLIAPLSEPQLGGVQTFLCDLARGLQQRGHDVTVFAAHGSRLEGVRVVDTGAVPAALAETRFRPGREQADAAVAAAAFGAAIELVRDGGYDLLHNHAFDVAAIGHAARLPIPVVHTLHLPEDPAIAAALASARRRPSPPTVAAVSHSQAAGWRRSTEVDALLRPGVPVDAIPWSAVVPSVGRLLFAGRLSPEKGALEAVAIARAAGRRLVICGPRYDPAYAAQVSAAAAAGGGDVEVRPAMSRRALWTEMSRSAAVICPVTWEEPFGLVAAEANACGTPVMGFRRGGLAEVVADTTTAILVAAGDVGAAAAGVERAVELSRATCRQHAERTLGLEACLDSHLAHYARATAGRRLAG